MRTSPRLLSLIAVLALLGGCKSATIIGTACSSDGDCNVAGQVCAPGFNMGPSICTRACTGQTGATGCPVGYDCFPTDTKLGSTCNKALYETDPTTGTPILFGVSCALGDATCGTLGSSNPGVMCRKIADPSSTTTPRMPVTNDPTAYCTGSCNTDGDCPLDFECLADYDKVKKCLRRTQCSACTVDANCGTEFPVCVPTTDGTSRYCTKPCNNTGDCGGVQNAALVCAASTTASGTAVGACLHRYGACVGQGYICDPCRVTADCSKSGTGAVCASSIATGERFCTIPCTADSQCTGGTIPSVCDDTDMTMSNNICNGDINHQNPGSISCWVPM